MPAGLHRFLTIVRTDRRAVTVIEYALMASLIGLAIFASVSGYAGGLGNMMTSTFGKIGAAM